MRTRSFPPRSAAMGSGLSPRHEDGTVRVWDADTGALIAVLEGHANILSSTFNYHINKLKEHSVNSAAFSHDGTRVIAASRDGTARVWRADTGALLAVLRDHAVRSRSAAFNADGTRIITVSRDGARVRDFEAVSGNPSVVPLWIEVLTGTELRGNVVRPLSRDEWDRRKHSSRSRRARLPPPTGVHVTVQSRHTNHPAEHECTREVR